MSVIDPQKHVTVVFPATSDRARHRFVIGPGAGTKEVLFAIQDRVNPKIHGVQIQPNGEGLALEPSGRTHKFSWEQVD